MQENKKLKEINNELVIRNNSLLNQIDPKKKYNDEIFENEKMNLLVICIPLRIIKNSLYLE